MVARTRALNNSHSVTLFAKSFVPESMYAKMTYCLQKTMASSATDAQLGVENVWQLNGCFDPDFTGGTHQPYGYDQASTLYGRYVVHGCRVSLEMQTPAAQTQCFAVAIQVQGSQQTFSLTGAAVSDLEEKEQSFVKRLASTGEVQRWSKYFNLWDIEGVTREQYIAQLTQYSSISSANPTQVEYLRIAVATMNGTTSANVYIGVKLEFDVQFFDRNVLPSSN